MSLTETRREATPDEPGETFAPVPERSGLAGWLSTTDHKKVGRLWIATGLVFLVIGNVVGAIVGVEQVNPGLDILDSETFGQVYTLHGEVAVFLFLVPLFLGLATLLVPLQVGSHDLAFPRGAAAAYWTYVASGLVLLASYAANGGPGGGSEVGVDLYLLSLLAITAATVLALVCVLTTIILLRAPGMTLERTPLFAWSMLVGGGLTLLSAPVLAGRLIELYVGHHFGGGFPDGGYGAISWFWGVPHVYLLTVPVVGTVLEIVPVFSGASSRADGAERAQPPARARPQLHIAAMVIIALTGVFGFGIFAQPVAPVEEHLDDLLAVVLGLAGLLPALALLGLLADAVRRGRLSLRAPFLLALGAAVQLFLGALAGAAESIEPLELRGTVWESAQVHYSLYGAAVLGAFAALWYWAPKIWGVHLGEAAGKAVFALTFFGAILLAAPDLVNGLFQNVALNEPRFDDDGLTQAMNGIRAAGGVLAVLGTLVAFGDVLGRAGRRRGTPATDDPWGGGTLEWATSSPPPPENFDRPVPVVSSPTPLQEVHD